MPANKPTEKDSSEIELSGKVVVKCFAAGSKSEHDAVYLETEKGSFVLRKAGDNPFNDTSLHKLEGKMVTAKGVIRDYLFLAKQIREISS